MDIVKIEASARELQLRIWEQRGILWPNEKPKLIDMLEPEIAAKVLGVDFEYYEELGRFGCRGARFETAG